MQFQSRNYHSYHGYLYCLINCFSEQKGAPFRCMALMIYTSGAKANSSKLNTFQLSEISQQIFGDVKIASFAFARTLRQPFKRERFHRGDVRTFRAENKNSTRRLGENLNTDNHNFQRKMSIKFSQNHQPWKIRNIKARRSRGSRANF